ncbi:GntR family transcriptional regulator [Pseudohoeflea coraliihabitans]|uniref:GntR family transcriptional regulator n=1 Tax=Pseudohoeflea coraliihabitans TaxID=2860393 RepID=A0ABS6WQB8_9HYPH|nr:GntR family transcriptional regulator [Pseudohoeflea sp. DP4N28-3]MBW3098161.1 GntR family transcriptional regulator [Pseudohoeflea sp. DP4N28-3]
MRPLAGDTAAPDSFAPARSKRQSMRDTAYAAIKRQIVNCELKPGEAVTVTELAQALDMGRTPVIQAIDRLTVDGLVEVMPRKGVVVSPVSLDDFVEIIEMRLVNEAQAVRWAAEKADRTQIERLQTNLDGAWSAARAHDIDRMIELDREFHRLISRAAGNSILSEFLGNLHDKALRFWFISLRAPDHNLRVCQQHADILGGIKNHDPAQAEAAMREHIASFHANASSQILRS